MTNRRGFTLFELLIVIAVIGIVSATEPGAAVTVVPIANMSKVSAHFEEAVRLARSTYVKDRSRIAIGLPPTAPSDTAGWITLFNSNNVNAPGGGPAYIPVARGNADDGAVGVLYISMRNSPFGTSLPESLHVWRPPYSSLVEQHAYVTPNDVRVVNVTSP